MHLAIDAQTLEIRAIEVTDNTIGDPPMLPELLAQIPADEPIGSVTADGAYDTRGCHEKWSGYHRRSLVETKMHCFKRLGERVLARTFERQVVALHVRVAILNRFTYMGRLQTVSVA